MRKKTGHVKDTEEKLGGASRACKGGRQMVGEHVGAWGSVGSVGSVEECGERGWGARGSGEELFA